MLEYLCNEESVEQIFNYMTSGSDSSKNGAGQIIQSLSQYYAFNANSFISGYPEGSEYYMIMLQQYENMPFLKSLVHNIPVFCKILSVKDISAAGGRETLGVHRLKIIEIMTQVIKIQFPSVQESFIEFNVLQHILDLFFKFEWHNILHQAVLNIILFIIQNSDKLKIRIYLKHLLCDQKMTQQFIDQVGDTHYYFDKVKFPNRSTTKGYLGYVIKISDELEKFYQNSIKTRANGDMLEWHNESWINFIEHTLDNHKEKGCKDLGNFDNFINGKTAAEQAPGEDDMAIYREYERQQAADRMKSRQNYQDQIELQKHYEQKKAKSVQEKENCEVILNYVSGTENDNNTSQNQKTEIQTETTKGQAEPNTLYGIGSISNNIESLSTSKQNVIFAQMDSKKIDDDLQVDEEEDEVQSKQPKQEIQEQTQTIIPSFNPYISDNPLIREIMEKYSPKKELILNQDGIIETPAQQEENISIINEKNVLQEVVIETNIDIKPILEENITQEKNEERQVDQILKIDQQVTEINNNEEKIMEQNITQEKVTDYKKTNEITSEEKNVDQNNIDDEEAINQPQQEGLVNNPISLNEQEQSILSNSDLKTISNQADDGEDLVEEEQNQNVIAEQPLINQNMIHSECNLDVHPESKQQDQNKSHSSTELGVLTDIKQQQDFQQQKDNSMIESELKVEVDPLNEKKDIQNTEELDINPISQSPEKTKNMDELSQNQIQEISERLNYFMSTSSTTVSERNKSAESKPNKYHQNKLSQSHSPNSRVNGNQTILSFLKTNANPPITQQQNISPSCEQSSKIIKENTIDLEEQQIEEQKVEEEKNEQGSKEEEQKEEQDEQNKVEERKNQLQLNQQEAQVMESQQQPIDSEIQVIEQEQQEILINQEKPEQEQEKEKINVQETSQNENQQEVEQNEPICERIQIHSIQQLNQSEKEKLQFTKQNHDIIQSEQEEQIIQQVDQQEKIESQQSLNSDSEKQINFNKDKESIEELEEQDNILKEEEQIELLIVEETQQQKSEQEIQQQKEDQSQIVLQQKDVEIEQKNLQLNMEQHEQKDEEVQQKEEEIEQKDLSQEIEQYEQNQEILKYNTDDEDEDEEQEINQDQKEESNYQQKYEEQEIIQQKSDIELEYHKSGQSTQQQISQLEFEPHQTEQEIQKQKSESEIQQLNEKKELEKKNIEVETNELKQISDQASIIQQQVPLQISQVGDIFVQSPIKNSTSKKNYEDQIANYENLKEEILLKYKNILTNQNQDENTLNRQIINEQNQNKTNNDASQEIQKEQKDILNNEFNQDKQKIKVEENLPNNLIQVDKSNFKQYIFTEESSNFNPINIQLDRVQDKGEQEQIQKSSKNPSPTGIDDQLKSKTFGRIEPLSSISTFKYEMKYTTPYSDNNLLYDIKQNDINQDQTKEKGNKFEKPNIEKISSVQQSPHHVQTPIQSKDIKPIQEVKDENNIPELLFQENDPTILANKKKFGSKTENEFKNLTSSLPTDVFRKNEEINQSSQYTTSERNKVIGTSSTQFKQQFQENMRASVDSQTINRTVTQQSLASSVDANSNSQHLTDIKLISSKSQNDAQLSPMSQKSNLFSQTQQERMQIQQLLQQKYGKSSSNNNSPQSSQITTYSQASQNPQNDPLVNHLTPTETKNVDFANPVSAHQHYSNYTYHQPHNNPIQQLPSQFSQQNLTIGSNNYSIIPNPISTNYNQAHQRLSTGMSQEEKMSYVEQETVLLKQKLASSKDYKSVSNQIRDLQSVYNIISDDNIVLIEQRIVTSQVIRQSFFDISEKNRINLETTINTLEEDKQHQEKELKLQYQIEFEMIEKQMRQEQDENKAKKKTQDFLQKLLVDRVNKLYQIHIKYSLQQRQTLEKALIEAKNLNEKLNTMHLSTTNNKQLSLEQITQVQIKGKNEPEHSNQSQQQNIQPHNQTYLQSTLTNQTNYLSGKTNDQDQQKYNVTDKSVPKQNHMIQTTNKTETVNKQGLSVQTVNHNKLSFEENSNSPCFGSQNSQTSLKQNTLVDSFSLGGSQQQKNQNQQQSGELSPTFGSVRKNSLSLRIGARKLSGTQTTEGDQVLEDPYDYKASSSARDKSPMPSQAAIFHSNSSQTTSTSNEHIRRLSQNVIPPQNQLPTRGTQTIPQQHYPIIQHTNDQQLLQQQNQKRIFENYTPPQSNIPNMGPDEQKSNSVKTNSQTNSSRSYYQDQQEQKINLQPTLTQNYSQKELQNSQQQQQLQQQQQPYRKIFSQSPIQTTPQTNIHQSYPQYGQNNYEQQQQIIKSQQVMSYSQLQQQNQQQSQQPKYQQQSQLQQLPSQQQQQYPQYYWEQQNKPTNEKTLFQNYSYSQPSLLKQQDDQYKKISENLKLSGYYNQPQVKTVQIDLGINDERKISDYTKSNEKTHHEPTIRANQGDIYQKQLSQPIHQQRSSYGQINQFSGSDSQEIENQFQFTKYISQNKSSHNTPQGGNTPHGNTPQGNTPVGSSSNLNPINSQQISFTNKEINNKLLNLTQLNDQHQNARYRPLSQSDIMYKNPHTHQQQELKFAKPSSPHSSSPQVHHSQIYPQYGTSNFQNSFSQSIQQYNQNPPITNVSDLLPPGVKQIIEKYTTGSASIYNSTLPNQQQYGQQSYSQQQYTIPTQQYYQSNYLPNNDKNKNYSDDQYSSYDKMKNSNTNYSTYSGRSSYYNQSGNNNDLLSQSDMNEESSINSQTSSSQYFEGIGGQNKKIKIVMKKPQQQPRPPSLHEAEQMGFQSMAQTKNQQQQNEMNQQQYPGIYQPVNLINSRQLQEKDKYFLNMLKPSKNN